MLFIIGKKDKKVVSHIDKSPDDKSGKERKKVMSKKSERRIVGRNYPKIRPFYSLKRELSKRGDVVVTEKYLAYKNSASSFPFFRISSKNIQPTDKVVLIRAGVHGNEISGPLTLLQHANQIFDYAHRNNIKLIIYPIGNPSGYALSLRYNADNYKGKYGNGDFLRYELQDGQIVDDLGKNPPLFKNWFWSLDVKDDAKLPLETAVAQKYLRVMDPLKQIRAVVDLHQDLLSVGASPYAYFYPFGDLNEYRPLVEKTRAIVPVLENTPIGAGFKTKIDEQGEVIESGQGEQDMPTDSSGFIVRHDGSLPDLFFRLGTKYCVTVETMGSTPMDKAIEVNLIWIFGMIDLAAKK